ncbi:MAG: response regulator [Anaerolineales bacterium]|nr:response regulator [Anaerolineales bacterium]
MTKILVAEDERDIQFLIAFALQAVGYEVLTANNGEEAVALTLKELPALVLTDVRMPKMTGYEACRQIKSNPATQHIPVVFLSAKGQEAEVQSGLDAGGDAYLLKPFEVSQLTKKVAEILDKTKPAPAA